MSQDFYSSGYYDEHSQQQPQNTQASPQTPNSPHPAPQFGYNPAQQPQYNNPQQQFYSSPQPDGYGQQHGTPPQQPYGTPQNYGTPPPQQQGYSEQYGTPQQHQHMSPNQGGGGGGDFYNSGGYYNPNTGGGMGTMGAAGAQGTSATFEDEPPLMEELGIDLQLIYQTTMTVLNPSKTAATNLMDDPDLSGPLMFCLGFGSLLLLSGKIHFGYIYGVALVGAVAMFTLLNLMSVNGVSASVTVSVLGYCMLPMCVLAGVSALVSLKGTLGIVLCAITVSWAAFASSKLFVSVLAMYDQQPLVAYPCALMYGVFAVLTVF